RRAVHPADVDAVKGTGDRVKPGRVDDDVKRVFVVAGLHTGRGDALDRGLVDVDQLDVGLVVNLVVATLERHAAGAKAVVFWDQLFGDRRVLDPLADFSREKIRDQAVGAAVDQDVAEIAHPDTKTGLAIELLPKSLALLVRH